VPRTPRSTFRELGPSGGVLSRGEEGGVHPVRGVKEILPSRTVTAGDRAFSCH